MKAHHGTAGGRAQNFGERKASTMAIEGGRKDHNDGDLAELRKRVHGYICDNELEDVCEVEI